MDQSLFGGAEMISVYTRAQAMEDGVLVDITDAAKRGGFRYPVAMTATALGKLLRGARCEDLAAIQAELFRVMHLAIRRGHTRSRMDFTVNGLTLYSLCGPGDAAEPVITIMLPDED